MKYLNCLIIFFPYFVIAQINIQHIANECPVPDRLSVCIEDYPYVGTYDYETTFQDCGNGVESASGSIRMDVNPRGHYHVDDFSFGAWAACFGDTTGTLGIVEMRAECSFIKGIFGTDKYGDIWSSDNFTFLDNSITFNWYNTYGDFGTTTLTPSDERHLSDPTIIIEEGIDVTWSTGEKTSSILTNETGLFEVTVTLENGIKEVASYFIDEDEPSLEEACSNALMDVFYFLDENENGVQDNGEVSLFPGEEYLVLYPSERLKGFIGAQHERYAIEPGTYVLSFVNPLFKATNLPSEINVEEVNDHIKLNIGLAILTDVSSIDINITATQVERCENIVPFQIRVQNNGTIGYTGSVSVQLDSLLQYVSSSVLPLSQTEKTISWFVDIPNPTGFNIITVYLLLPSSDYIGENICISIDDNSFTKSVNDYCFELRCSHDPNDKHGVPHRGENNQVLNSESLEYTIRFENLGNDTAFSVIIVDPLSDNIDENSFRLIQSSHTVNEYYIDNDRFINFVFNSIDLPSIAQDSFLNKGFVQFTVDLKPDLPEGTVINNTAEIYFDQNAPIITNVTAHTLVKLLRDSTDLEGSVMFSTWPTIVTDILHTNLNLEYKNISSVTVYNVTGNPFELPINKNTIDVSSLEGGIFYLEIIFESGQKGFIKFLKIQ